MNKMVSIITPVFNSEKYITETIESVLNQTYKNFELILIDNQSQDNSVEIISKFQEKDSRIKLIKLDKNYGPAKARNSGIESANGDYISFLDSDDVLYKNYLKKQIKFMEEKKAAIVYSSFKRKSEDMKQDLGDFKVKYEVTYNNLLRKNYLSCLSTMIDISKIGKFYFKEGVNSEDHLYWLELLKENNLKAIGNTEVLAIYRIRKNLLSRNKFKAAQWKWEIYRRHLKLGLIKSSFLFIMYAVNGVISNYKCLKVNVGEA